MKIKIFILCLLSVLVFANAKSQQFGGGLLGGLSAGQVDGDTQKGYKKLGFYSGVYVTYNFSELFGIKIETFYIGKGAKKIINKVEDFKSHFNYIEMPFMLSIKPVNKFRFNIGLAGSYLINSKLYKKSYEIPEDRYDINSFDWGGIITGEYYLSEKLAFNVRFEYSIVPFRTESRRWYNSNLSFGLLYTILQ